MPILEKRSRDHSRKAASTDAFLDATAQLLAEGESFADLNVSRIAERAGRTRTAFYAHFEDRRELLLVLFERAGVAGLSASKPFLENINGLSHDQISSSVAGLFGIFRDQAPLLRAVVEAAGYDDEIAAFWHGVVSRFIEGAQKQFRAEGLHHEEAAALASTLVWMTERSCYQQAVRGGTDLDDEAMVAAIANVWWAVIQASRNAARPGAPIVP